SPNNGTTVLQDCGQPAIQHRDEEQAPHVYQASFVQGTKSLEILTKERSLNGTYGSAVSPRYSWPRMTFTPSPSQMVAWLVALRYPNTIQTNTSILSTAEEYFNDSCAHPPSTTTDRESTLPPPTLSLQLPRPIPTITTLPLNHQPTYTSVLRQPTRTPPRSILETREPVPSTISILTIEDLHRRFHNKPSPFQVESKTRKRSASHNRNKPISATNSLSKFPTSALPAFSRFLAMARPQQRLFRCY
ncbi:uncharacterized protein N7473_001734, partial [Penicillium subrubescens]|uniref:uncharacterized protein n=1 Tax=Penicillium subrubescens TaxID=1316194 RepID=UPI002545378E